MKGDSVSASTARDDDDDWGNTSVVQSESSKGKKDAMENMFQAVSLAWSCNGATLAVAYGKNNH